MSQPWWYTLVILSLRRLQQGDCKFETKNLSQKPKPKPKKKKKTQTTKNENKMLSKLKCYFGLLYYYFCPGFEFPCVFRIPSTAQFGLANRKCSGTSKPRTVVQTQDALLTWLCGFLRASPLSLGLALTPLRLLPLTSAPDSPDSRITPAGNGSHVNCTRIVSSG